jgi:hypothetical protein
MLQHCPNSIAFVDCAAQTAQQFLCSFFVLLKCLPCCCSLPVSVSSQPQAGEISGSTLLAKDFSAMR